MNVGFSLLTLFPGRVGGSESNVRGLLEQFAAGNGPAAVTVLANRHVMRAYADLDRGPVSLCEVRSYRPGDSPPTRALAMAGARLLRGRAARDVPPGLDLLHYPVTVPIPSTSLPRVTTVYDVQHHDMPHFFSRAERAFRRWAYDDAARTADLVLTTSAWSRERLVELLELEPERVEVVHMGVDLERFRPAPAAIDERLPAELGLPDRFLIYPANLWPHKNHHRLVAALARARDREIRLVLTGRDYGRLEALMAEASSLGVRRSRAPPRLRAARRPARAIQACGGDGVPQPVRGLRVAAARGHGLRLPRGRLAERLARRGLRRRRARHRA